MASEASQKKKLVKNKNIQQNRENVILYSSTLKTKEEGHCPIVPPWRRSCPYPHPSRRAGPGVDHPNFP